MNKQRLAGIEKEMTRVISNLFMMGELKNSQLKKAMISVNHIRVTEDLKFADVYFTVMPLKGENVDIAPIVEALDAVKGILRKRVSEELSLRYTPEIRVKIDESIEHAMKITKLLNDIKG